MKLEVVVIPVSDVDRAKEFYGSLGWRRDADFAACRPRYAAHSSIAHLFFCDMTMVAWGVLKRPENAFGRPATGKANAQGA
jgi:catechol 2,3-dioxygenase-like lactoylglutathione lyase family enzyme